MVLIHHLGGEMVKHPVPRRRPLGGPESYTSGTRPYPQNPQNPVLRVLRVSIHDPFLDQPPTSCTAANRHRRPHERRTICTVTLCPLKRKQVPVDARGSLWISGTAGRRLIQERVMD